MEQVEVHIDISGDSSGWSYNVEHDTRTAYIYKNPDETQFGQYILILPLENELEKKFEKNMIEHEGIRGLKLTNVNPSYIEF